MTEEEIQAEAISSAMRIEKKFWNSLSSWRGESWSLLVIKAKRKRRLSLSFHFGPLCVPKKFQDLGRMKDL
jgi:hypothetical protein